MLRNLYQLESLESRRLFSAMSLVDGILTVARSDATDEVLVAEAVLYDVAAPVGMTAQPIVSVQIRGGPMIYETQPGLIKEVRIYDNGADNPVLVAPNVQVPVSHTSTPPVEGKTDGIATSDSPTPVGTTSWQPAVFVLVDSSKTPAPANS
jgi:hypothetical protein